MHDRVPDATTIWFLREQLARADVAERWFEQFDALLGAGGLVGQIVHATVMAGRRPRLT